MRLITIIYVLLLSMPFSAYSSSNSNVVSLNEVKQYVDDLVNKATNLLNNPNLSEDKKTAEATKLIHDNLDFPWMANFVLGADRKSLSTTQIEQFTNSYATYTTRSYTSLLKSYKNEKVSVLKVIAINKENSEFIVKTKISQNGAPDTLVDYLVRNGEAGIKVADIIADGVSVIRSQQAEFHSIITTKGFDGLLTELTRPRS